MKSTIIEGISDSKIKRLKKHLLKAEKRMGGELRPKPGYTLSSCPLLNFAPLFIGSYPIFSFYDAEDSYWWRREIRYKQRIAITRHIQQWIKEGKKL